MTEHNVNSVKLIAVMLLFYLIIASNFTKNLMSHQLTSFFEENRYAQHLIGFIMMLSLIMLISGINNIETGILYAIIAYFWFIFTTKLDIQWNIMIILLLFFGFIYESKLAEKDERVMNDASLSNEEKERIINEHNKYKVYLVFSVILITVIGSTLYANKKHIQYGGGFDIMTFIFN